MKRIVLIITAMLAFSLPAFAQETVVKEKQAPQIQTRERTQTTVQTGPKAKFSERTTARVSRTEVIKRHPEFRERHDKVFFEGRFGHHFRFFSPFNEYFVFVDGCWVAVDVDGFVYTDRVICPGDPNFIEVEVE